MELFMNLQGQNCYEFQKLNGSKTGECKVTLGYKLPAKDVFHTVGHR